MMTATGGRAFLWSNEAQSNIDLWPIIPALNDLSVARPESSAAPEDAKMCCRARLYGKGCLMSTAAGSLACGLKDSRATLISGSVCSPAWTQWRWSAQSPGEGRLQHCMASSLRLHSLSQCTIRTAWRLSACWSSSGVSHPLAGWCVALLPRARKFCAAWLRCPLKLFSFAIYKG